MRLQPTMEHGKQSVAGRRRPRSVLTMATSAGMAMVAFTCTQTLAFQPSARINPVQTREICHDQSYHPTEGVCRPQFNTELYLSTLVEYDVENEHRLKGGGGFMRMSPFVESDVEVERSVIGSDSQVKALVVEESDSWSKEDLAEMQKIVQQSEGERDERVQFRGLSTTSYRGRYRKKQLSVSERRGRVLSSTMPGFSAESDRQRAFRAGIQLAEKKSGRKFVDTPEKQSKRKRRHGEAMYRNSAAVPDSLVQFADEIHQEDRITRQEEKHLGELTQEAVRLQRIFESLRDDLDREPTDQEWCAASGKINMKAIEQAIEEGFEAKNKLVTSNLRMVQSVVNTYIRNGLSSQYNAGDMMQEGILALIRAAEKFEPERGWKFSTYAMYWVRASVKRNQVAQSRSMPVPHRVYETHKRIMRVQRELTTSLGRKPSKKEIGDSLGLSELQVERCISAMKQSFHSLDQEIQNTYKPHSDPRKDRLVEIVESKAIDEEFGLKGTFLREAFIETLQRHLKDDQEVELLCLRYGLKSCPEQSRIGGQPTIDELSRAVGLKPDKVRRIINRALKQLKQVNPEEWLAFERELC